MTLRVENSGSVDIENNWSISSCTRHMDARLYFLRDLKEEGIANTMWTPIKNNLSDFFTNNFTGTYFNKNLNR